MIELVDEYGFYYSSEYSEIVRYKEYYKICEILENSTFKLTVAETVNAIRNSIQGCEYVKVYFKDSNDKNNILERYKLDIDLQVLQKLLDSFCEIDNVYLYYNGELYSCNVYIRYTVQPAKINILKQMSLLRNDGKKQELIEFVKKIDDYFEFCDKIEID